MTGWSSRVEPCPPEAREAALQVLYQRIPDSLRSRLIVEVLQEASCGQVDLSGLWVAWNCFPGPGTTRCRIIGTFLTQALAGRAAAIWAPEVLPSWWRATTAAALVRSALADLQAHGFRIVQAVLDESASRRGAIDLIRGGMPRVTELLYLERDTQVPLPESGSLGPLSGSRQCHPASYGAPSTRLARPSFAPCCRQPTPPAWTCLSSREFVRSTTSSKAIARRAGSSLTAGSWARCRVSPTRPLSCFSPRSPVGTSGKLSTLA